MRKIIIIVLIISGISLYGNFSQINPNLALQEQMNGINSKNIELSNPISSLTIKISSLEAKLSKPESNSFRIHVP